MKIGIITIGNELLNGMRIDTNSSWIGESVQPAGGNIVWKVSVVDDKKQIIHVLNLISDNIGLDTSTQAMQMYSQAATSPNRRDCWRLCYTQKKGCKHAR